jgi:hypothetical protein
LKVANCYFPPPNGGAGAFQFAQSLDQRQSGGASSGSGVSDRCNRRIIMPLTDPAASERDLPIIGTWRDGLLERQHRSFGREFRLEDGLLGKITKTCP